MPLGLGTTVDYIFFSAESGQNGDRTGKPGGSWVPKSHPHESLTAEGGQASGGLAWAAGT